MRSPVEKRGTVRDKAARGEEGCGVGGGHRRRRRRGREVAERERETGVGWGDVAHEG
jgi:hypothetical protein